MCPSLCCLLLIAPPPLMLMVPCNCGSRLLNHVHGFVALTRRAVIEAAALHCRLRRRPSPSVRLGSAAFEAQEPDLPQIRRLPRGGQAV
jgi:hypothetical protein